MSPETKHFYEPAYREGHASRYGDVELVAARNEELGSRTDEWLTATGLAHDNHAKILEIGCGMAGLATIHPGWHGAEYSRAAVERVKCHIPDDHIDKRRYPLFYARELLKAYFASSCDIDIRESAP